jgi:hypothetical protein
MMHSTYESTNSTGPMSGGVFPQLRRFILGRCRSSIRKKVKAQASSVQLLFVALPKVTDLRLLPPELYHLLLRLQYFGGSTKRASTFMFLY